MKVTVIVTNEIEDIEDGGAPERAENTYSAILTRSESSDTLSYSEDTDGGRVVTDIKIMDDRFILRRSGGISSVMHFEEGRRHLSSYKIPPYEFDMELETNRISVERSADRILVSAKYLMTVGGAKKRCSMSLAAVPEP
jgi:uncharacterized beta-barrel protein YwiB (DUF1934 family)